MIFIKKNKEPVSFKEWKNNFKKATYKNLKGKIKADLRNSLLEEQGYICCFPTLDQKKCVKYQF